MFLRQSTSQVIRFGPCLDITDGVTEETALTLAQADMRLSKDGGAFAQKNATGNATHDSDGWYSTTLDTTDTATVGELIMNVHQPANMLPVWIRWYVIEEAVYDALYAASAAGPLQSTTAGRTLDITATGAAGIDWANVENPTTALDLSGTDIQLVDTTTTNTDMRGTDSAALASVLGALTDAAAAGDPTTADTVIQYAKQLINVLVGTTGVTTFPAAAAPANGVSLAEVIRAVYDDTNSLDGTKIPDTISLAAIADSVWDEVLTGATHNISNSAGRRLRQLQEAGGYSMGGVYIDTVNGAAGTTNFENGVETNPSSNIADANTLAASLGISRFFIAPGSSITLAAAQENQELVGENWILALGGQSVSNSHIKGAEVSGTATSATEAHFDHCEMGTCTVGEAHIDDCDLTATITLSAAAEYFFIGCNHSGASIIDFGAAILNTTVHVHNYSGALIVNNMGQAGTDVLHFDSGGGKLTLGATCIGGTVNLNGTFNFVNNGSGLTINDDGAIIEVIGTPVGASVSADNAGIKAETALIVADTNELQTDDVPGLISALNDISTAQVNTEVVDALNTDTYAEPAQGAPGATISLAAKIGHLYKAWRNRSNQTSTTYQLFNDDATTVDHKATVSDDGTTAEKGEVATGP